MPFTTMDNGFAAERQNNVYGSKMKDWKLLSDFGKEIGAHGGVWECPDFSHAS
jgi:levanase/fructan beta-fructosidase